MLPASGIVLVIDDDAAVRAAAEFALEMDGLRAQPHDGPEVLLADPRLPARACLVTDHSMPGLDGIEPVKTLRRGDLALQAIVISGSGRAHERLRNLAKRTGIAQILEKPLSAVALADRTRQALSAA